MQRGTIQTLMQLQLKGLLMRTIILYASRHHGNTKKLVDAIVEAHPEIDTLDVKALGKNEYPDLHEYHLIGVATGIYYSEIDKDMARVLTNVLQPQNKVFGLMTYCGKNKWYGKDIDGICRMRQAIFMEVYGCPGLIRGGRSNSPAVSKRDTRPLRKLRAPSTSSTRSKTSMATSSSKSTPSARSA